MQDHGGVPTVLTAKLPFTGLSLWLALAIATGLLAGGVVLRRLAPRTQ
jgi:hypothetical protein